ncbi:hypothetical protein KAFR_0E02110 [Kazachstania africana CBS 2517]|uniref:Maintenance of telomere capping protein 6 n=1 Tax=Kazachstania africana (strain ATCC 22294 / BCRC 22015 / CBS 2517 / CECT 1963 / NBRC 1671 / NRRL Y-8276) TaxID=1071382 RepID=H2AVG4_KAZAF|nr:hypothetical protein KAFR_0E02110 [Kazachstania africana CBS 2517]CCF58364.1 hypothetical protein KAFR_0E02110 [Kazachstania africana CBS 2517]
MSDSLFSFLKILLIWSAIRYAIDKISFCYAINHTVYPEWPGLTAQELNGIRSQRDLMNNVTIDQLPLVGVNLQQVLFNSRSEAIGNQTNTVSSLNGTYLLDSFTSLLESGVQGFVLDIELQNGIWVIVDTPLSFETFLTTLHSHILETDNTLFASLLVMFLRISSISNETNSSSIHSTTPTQNLADILTQQVGSSYIYTQDDLLSHNSLGVSGLNSTTPEWPTLKEFLYGSHKRLFIAELSTNYLSTSSYVFPNSLLHYDIDNATLSCPQNMGEFKNVQNISWKFLESSFTDTDISEYISCGLSPIISNSFDVTNLTEILSLLDNSVVWSWANGEPRYVNSESDMGKDPTQAYNCASLTFNSYNSSMDWKVINCYNSKGGLCQKNDDEYTWLVSNGDKDSYIDFYKKADINCPEGYHFSLPVTPLQKRSLNLHLSNSSDNDDLEVWININSLAVSNCWVTGGASTQCPYQTNISKRSFVGMMAPLAACAFVLLVIVVYLSLVSVPIHDNRKNWRRVINKVSKSEFEGVPT